MLPAESHETKKNVDEKYPLKNFILLDILFGMDDGKTDQPFEIGTGRWQVNLFGSTN